MGLESRSLYNILGFLKIGPEKEQKKEKNKIKQNPQNIIEDFPEVGRL